MLTLFKYDISRNMSKMLAAMLILCGTLALLMLSYFINSSIIASAITFVCFMASITSIVICVVYCITAFFNTMSGNQSYLTYTIPYKTTHIIFSKMLAAVIWIVLCIALNILVWAIYNANVGLVDFAQLWASLEGLQSFLAMVIITQFIYIICLVSFCVSLTVLPVFRNKGVGVVAGIVGYVVLNFVSSIIEIAGILLSAVMNGNIGIILSDTSDAAVSAAINDSRFVISGVFLILAVIYLVLTIKVFSKHRAI